MRAADVGRLIQVEVVRVKQEHISRRRTFSWCKIKRRFPIVRDFAKAAETKLWREAHWVLPLAILGALQSLYHVLKLAESCPYVCCPSAGTVWAVCVQTSLAGVRINARHLTRGAGGARILPIASFSASRLDKVTDIDV